MTFLFLFLTSIIRFADPLNPGRTDRKVDQIEDVERGAELSFSGPLRGPLTWSAKRTPPLLRYNLYGRTCSYLFVQHYNIRKRYTLHNDTWSTILHRSFSYLPKPFTIIRFQVTIVETLTLWIVSLVCV